MNKFYLSAIYIYPIKSLGGISVAATVLEEKGLRYDRRWMLIDEDGVFITQRKHPVLSLLTVNIVGEHLVIKHKVDAGLMISFNLDEHHEELVEVNVWDDTTSAYEVNTAVSKWFSTYMQMNVKLVVMPGDVKRKVDVKYAKNNEIVSFADGYPCLLIGQSSLNELNARLAEPVKMDRFRPNFVFTGGEAHIEDKFDIFLLGEASFRAVKPCARCVLITIDQETGNKGTEPLKTLATYRNVGNKIMFGQNLLHKGTGLLQIGDELKIQQWKANGE